MPKFNPDSYEPKTFNLPEGDYDFEVVNATEKVSRAQNDMINLELLVDDQMKVYENLVFTEKALFNINQFCEATGKSEQWKSGELSAEDCLGACGKCHLALGDPGEDGKRYMRVAYFIEQRYAEAPKISDEQKQKLQAARAATAEPFNPMDEDIPF